MDYAMEFFNGICSLGVEPEKGEDEEFAEYECVDDDHNDPNCF